jgi:beta-galactosidase
MKAGKSVVTQAIHTVGEACALRLTPITGPGGLRANGSDVALIDLEAVDAKGRRCPAFQQRVDFECAGAAIWRGGYNSGKTNSINNTDLDLECGINRVAILSTLQPGTIVVTAKYNGLKSGSLNISSRPFAIENGYAKALPRDALSSVGKRTRISNLSTGEMAGAINQTGKTTNRLNRTIFLSRNSQPGGVGRLRKCLNWGAFKMR